MNEVWVDMWDYPKYEISNFGNVRNKKTGRLISIRVDAHGYRMVSITRDGKTHTKRVGRYTWMSHNNQFCRKTIDHKDENKTNDNLDNLQCISMKANFKKRKPIIKGNKYNISDADKRRYYTNYILGKMNCWDIHKETGAPLNYIKMYMKRGSWRKYL